MVPSLFIGGLFKILLDLFEPDTPLIYSEIFVGDPTFNILATLVFFERAGGFGFLGESS
jgi:hypothetical protein